MRASPLRRACSRTLAVLEARESLGQMRREPLKLHGKSLLGHLDGGLEALADTGLFRLEDAGVQGDEKVGRLDRRVGDFHVEHPVERRGVVDRRKSVPRRRWASSLRWS
ncbi:MAG: hypothetical protein EXS06_10585 [Planctomycetaceae bacterium]|nr:hypothetical protein [Planctomycetaceae bacterium]